MSSLKMAMILEPKAQQVADGQRLEHILEDIPMT